MAETAFMIAINPTSFSFLIRPSGALDSMASDHYRRNVVPLFNQGYRHSIIDMERTETMGSSGLGLLVALYKHTNIEDGSIRIINCCRNVRNLLHRTKLDSILSVKESQTPIWPSMDIPERTHPQRI